MNEFLTWDYLEPLCGWAEPSVSSIGIRKRRMQPALPMITGIPALDECVGGLRAGDLIAIQGSGLINWELRNTIALKVAEQQASALIATTDMFRMSGMACLEAFIKGVFLSQTREGMRAESKKCYERRYTNPKKMLLWMWTIPLKIQCDRRHRKMELLIRAIERYYPRVLLINDVKAMVYWAIQEWREKTQQEDHEKVQPTADCILRQFKALAVKYNLTVITNGNPPVDSSNAQWMLVHSQGEALEKFYGVAENEADVVLKLEHVDSEKSQNIKSETLPEQTVKVRVTVLQKGVEKEVQLSYVRARRRFESE